MVSCEELDIRCTGVEIKVKLIRPTLRTDWRRCPLVPLTATGLRRMGGRRFRVILAVSWVQSADVSEVRCRLSFESDGVAGNEWLRVHGRTMTPRKDWDVEDG